MLLASITAPPPPPWTFQARRIHYQFRTVPITKARQCLSCPSDALTLLSLGGYTLGGLFAVDYKDSPIGPYREVAVLSGLVAKDFSVGAWASHIFVDSYDAALYGREFWGLPAAVVPIHFDETPKENTSELEGKATSFLIGKNFVEVNGWSNLENCPNPTIFRLLETVTLPSFSGCLVNDDEGCASTPSPLLRYQLSIKNPNAISISEAGNANCEYNGLLKEILQDGKSLFSVNFNNVSLSAGEPTVISQKYTV